jgi:hypothetical protein
VFDQDAKEDEITVQVCLFAFDLLYLNGKVHHASTQGFFLASSATANQVILVVAVVSAAL